MLNDAIINMIYWNHHVTPRISMVRVKCACTAEAGSVNISPLTLNQIRIQKFLGIPDLNPLVRGTDPDPSIINLGGH